MWVFVPESVINFGFMLNRTELSQLRKFTNKNDRLLPSSLKRLCLRDVLI